MTPSGPRTIAQVCTLEYCHPANGSEGRKQDNPRAQKKKHGLRGEGRGRKEEKGTCEMLIELRPTFRGGKERRLPIHLLLQRPISAVRKQLSGQYSSKHAPKL